jgi:hypothetical protein
MPTFLLDLLPSLGVDFGIDPIFDRRPFIIVS